MPRFGSGLQDHRPGLGAVRPGADGNPASEGNAYLSTGLGPEASGIASTVPPSDIVECTMVPRGPCNNGIRADFAGTGPDLRRRRVATTRRLTVGARRHSSSPATSRRQPAANASPYLKVLTFPNVNAVNPTLDDFYAEPPAWANVFHGSCPGGQNPTGSRGPSPTPLPVMGPTSFPLPQLRRHV